MIYSEPLQKWYHWANWKWFNNQLPYVRIGWQMDGMTNEYAVTINFKPGKYAQYILLNPIFEDWNKTVFPTLLHEMCHVKLNNKGGHGPRFQKELKRLVKLGAFDKYL